MRAGAPRAVAHELGLREPGGSGFGMLRRSRAGASLPHTHTPGAPAGDGEEWDSGPRPGGTRRRVGPGPEGKSRTKGCAGCHREVTEGRFATPRLLHLPVLGVGPPGVGGS